MLSEKDDTWRCVDEYGVGEGVEATLDRSHRSHCDSSIPTGAPTDEYWHGGRRWERWRVRRLSIGKGEVGPGPGPRGGRPPQESRQVSSPSRCCLTLGKQAGHPYQSCHAAPRHERHQARASSATSVISHERPNPRIGRNPPAPVARAGMLRMDDHRARTQSPRDFLTMNLRGNDQTTRATNVLLLKEQGNTRKASKSSRAL